MKCLRCGYCCIQYTVIIVDNPDLGIDEDNLIVKDSNERCKHLLGNEPGKFSCAIHDYPWYNQTPCYAYGQIEISPEDPCRMGAYIMASENKELRMKLR